MGLKFGRQEGPEYVVHGELPDYWDVARVKMFFSEDWILFWHPSNHPLFYDARTRQMAPIERGTPQEQWLRRELDKLGIVTNTIPGIIIPGQFEVLH